MNIPYLQLQHPSKHIARLTYNNPPVNLVVGDTVRSLGQVVERLLDDTDLKVVILDSAVPDFFYNHFDLAHLADFPTTDLATARNPWTDIVVKLANAPFITVGLIRGRTRGGGNELALALDLRYASREKAKFGQPEVGVGIVPGGGGTERLPRTIGRDRALEAILTSKDYDADTAERWGWVTRTLADDDLDAFVNSIAGRIASFDAHALAQAKTMINRASLPPEADLVAAYREFEDSTRQPGYRARAEAPTPPPEQQLLIEYDLGDVIGAAAQRAAQE
nr:enoyl-CoA hydratase/isomerase family protein [Dactylosporangium thailandense]